MNKRSVLSFGFILCLLSTQAFAQNSPASNAPAGTDNKPTVTTFNDWVLTCRKAGSSPQAQQVCEITQSFSIQGQSAPFAQLAIGRLDPKQPIVITVVVPHNVSFPSAVNFSSDDKGSNPLTLNWTRCLATGCFSSSVVSDDVIKNWRALTQSGRVIFKNALGQDVILPVSFKGFAQAMDALSKSK